MSPLTLEVLIDPSITDRFMLSEHGIWKDKQGKKHHVSLLSNGYLFNILRFSKGVMERQIRGELEFRETRYDYLTRCYEDRIERDNT